GRGRVSRQEVADYVAAHQVQLGEVERGGAPQRPLTQEELYEIDERLANEGVGDLDLDQEMALIAGGEQTEHMLDALRMLGIRVRDMRGPGRAHWEETVQKIRE